MFNQLDHATRRVLVEFEEDEKGCWDIGEAQEFLNRFRLLWRSYPGDPCIPLCDVIGAVIRELDAMNILSEGRVQKRRSVRIRRSLSVLRGRNRIAFQLGPSLDNHATMTQKNATGSLRLFVDLIEQRLNRT